jgi:hypothetical protein
MLLHKTHRTNPLLLIESALNTNFLHHEVELHVQGPFEKFVDWWQITTVMQREAVTVMPSCSGEDNVVVV